MRLTSGRGVAAVVIASLVTAVVIALSFLFTWTPGAYRLQVGHAVLVMLYGTALAFCLPPGRQVRCALSLSVLASIQVAWIAVALSLVSTLSFSGPDTNVLAGGLFLSGIVLAIPLMKVAGNLWPFVPMGLGGTAAAAISMAGFTLTSSGNRVAVAVVPLHLALAWTLCFIAIRSTKRSLPGHCSDCGYDLAGLGGVICPECGASVPTANASTTQ
ncbi:MAG: hypothetical protein ACIAQU_05840 [Phycisphaerales bacterium JB064]